MTAKGSATLHRSAWDIGVQSWYTVAIAFISRLIDASKATALMVLTATATGSPAAVAVLAVCASAPVILLGPSIGVQIDRRSPSKMLVAGLCTQAAAALLLATLNWLGHASVPILAGGALLLGTSQAVTDNCLNVLLPHVTKSDRVLRANGIMSTGQSTARIIGPMAGSALAVLAPVALFGSWAVLSVLLALLVVVRIGTTRIEMKVRETRPAWRDGFAWIAGSGPIRKLLTAVTLNNVAFGCMAAVLPILAMDSLDMPPATYGLVASVSSLSGLLGSVIVTTAGAKATLRMASVGSLTAQLLGFVALAISWSALSLFAAVGVLGLSTGVWNVVSSTTLMEVVPPEVRGRVMAAYRSIAFAGSPAGSLVGGVSGEGWIRIPLYAASFAAAISLGVFARPARVRHQLE